jgi:hypothetical protein
MERGEGRGAGALGTGASRGGQQGHRMRAASHCGGPAEDMCHSEDTKRRASRETGCCFAMHMCYNCFLFAELLCAAVLPR